MILIQSYTAPSEMHPKSLFEKFDDIKVVFSKSDVPGALGIKKILWLALKSNLVSKRGELIFGWGGPVALYAWAIGNLLCLKRKYYSQNLIFREESKASLKGKFVYWLYKKALQSKNFAMTVNSEQLVDYYSNMFGCHKDRFSVVYDGMSLNEDEQNMRKNPQSQPYVFGGGGKAARDIKSFMEIVKALPDVHFKCVFLREAVVPEMYELKNLEVYTDVPKKEFYEILNNATVCCIPLKSKAPCGLYVMQHAILLNIPIVSTETFSMRTIVPNDECGYLMPMGDVKGMAEKVRILIDDKDLRKRLSHNALLNFDKFSPENVGKQLCNAIDNYLKSFND